MDIDFGEEFTKNYLKLISNIYFINLKKTQQIFKSNYINQKFFFKNYNHLNDVLSEIYFFGDFRSQELYEISEKITIQEFNKIFNYNEISRFHISIFIHL
jgi:hypothetical protein